VFVVYITTFCQYLATSIMDCVPKEFVKIVTTARSMITVYTVLNDKHYYNNKTHIDNNMFILIAHLHKK